MQHDERERVLQWLLKVKNFPAEQESLGPSIYDLHTERGESNTTPNLRTNEGDSGSKYPFLRPSYVGASLVKTHLGWPGYL